jgi:hypothetical protein
VWSRFHLACRSFVHSSQLNLVCGCLAATGLSRTQRSATIATERWRCAVATVIARPCPTAWLVRLGASTPQPMGSTLGSRWHDWCADQIDASATLFEFRFPPQIRCAHRHANLARFGRSARDGCSLPLWRLLWILLLFSGPVLFARAGVGVCGNRSAVCDSYCAWKGEPPCW